MCGDEDNGPENIRPVRHCSFVSIRLEALRNVF